MRGDFPAEGSSTWWDKQTPTQTDPGLVLEHNPGAQQGLVKLTVVEPVPTGSEFKFQQ